MLVSNFNEIEKQRYGYYTGVFHRESSFLAEYAEIAEFNTALKSAMYIFHAETADIAEFNILLKRCYVYFSRRDRRDRRVFP